MILPQNLGSEGKVLDGQAGSYRPSVFHFHQFRCGRGGAARLFECLRAPRLFFI